MLYYSLQFHVSYSIAWLLKCILYIRLYHCLFSSVTTIKYAMHNILVLPASCQRLYLPITAWGERTQRLVRVQRRSEMCCTVRTVEQSQLQQRRQSRDDHEGEQSSSPAEAGHHRTQHHAGRDGDRR